MPSALIPIIAAGAQLGGSILSAKAANKASGVAKEAIGEDQRIRREILAQIQPFANFLLQMGINPVQFLSTPQGQALLGGILEPINKEFGQSRQNIVDQGLGAGFNPNAALANSFNQQAGATSAARRDLIAQALGLGVQGATILQGQQAQFNPNTLIAALLANPPQSTLGAGLSGFGIALGGLSPTLERILQQKNLDKLLRAPGIPGLTIPGTTPPWYAPWPGARIGVGGTAPFNPNAGNWNWGDWNS